MAGIQSATKRTVLVVLVVSLVLFGLGAGAIGMGDSQPADSASPASETETTPDPGEPTVTVTPPETATPPAGTSTASTPRNTATETSTPSASASLRVDVSPPDDVANGKGKVGPLWGTMDGTLAWNGSVDSAVVVVSVLGPDEGWVERERVTVRPEGTSLSLQTLFDGEQYEYLGADLAEGFDNPESGTTVTRTGFVGVTAVLFENGEQRTRLTETADYRFDVSNTGGVDISLSNPDGEHEDVNVDSSGSSGSLPGENASRSITVNNTGEFAGTVRVFLTDVRGSENGFAPPEAAVDDDQESELLELLELRIAVLDDSDRRYVLGGPDTWVNLEDIEEDRAVTSFGLDPSQSRSVVVEWRIPASAGNEVMTDTADWDVKFVFESDGAE
jgi:hypothetical protein